MGKASFSVLIAALLVTLSFGHMLTLAIEEQGGQTTQYEGTTVTSFDEMRYPPAAQVTGQEGDVVVQVKLDDGGGVESATSIWGYDFLARDAVVNARKWRFRPNKSRSAIIVYEFRFAKGACGPSRSQLFVFRKPNIASVLACASIQHWQPDSK